MREFSAILFDLDGTLIDSEPLWMEAVGLALDGVGCHYTTAELYCLIRLYADTQHTVTQEVVHGLTFEELIGTLLLARDLYEECRRAIIDLAFRANRSASRRRHVPGARPHPN